MEKFKISTLDPKALVLVARESIVKFLRYLSGSANLGEPSRSRLVGVVLILIGGHLYYRQKFSFWSSRNIKTPRPLPGVGNLLSFAFKPRLKVLEDWTRKYGRVFGYYSGSSTPILVCADAGLLKKICIKDFDKFPNRLFVGHPNNYQKHFLITLKDDHWRAVRSISSPTFSSGKIKDIFQLLQTCAENLVRQHEKIIRDQGGEFGIVDSRKISGPFSLESSMKAFYGIQLETENPDSLNSPQSFAKMVKTAVGLQAHRFLLASFLPGALVRWLHYPLFSEKQMAPLAERAQKIVQHRRENPKDRSQVDYLQLLFDAKADDKEQLASSNNFEEHHALDITKTTSLSNQSRTKYKLTEDELICNSMSNIFVSSETSATLISSTVFLLANHPAIQDRLYAELVELCKTQPDNKTFEYDSLTSCVYLDCVVSEALRLMSPAIYLDRIASEDYYVEEYDFVLPKGTPVILPFAAILKDPEYWPEPELFDPERFAPENKSKIVPGSYCPFGVGPRACIGFRFALTEVKLGLARLITTFKFEKAPGTKYPAEPARNTYVINEHKGMFVKFSLRTK